jgi:hypothetical protein
MIRFQGSFTRETLLRAVRLTMGRYRRLRWYFGAMLVIAFFGSVVVPLLNGAPFDPVTLLPPLVFVILLGLVIWSPYAAVDRSLKTNKLIQEPLEGHADETGVYFSTPHSRSDLPWDLFHKAVMSDSMVLLGQSSAQFYPFPREFFASDEDWSAFQALVREKAPQSKDSGGRLLRIFLIWTAIFVVVILLWTAFQANR